MKNISTQIVLKSLVGCFLLFNVALLFYSQRYRLKFKEASYKIKELENTSLKFDISKEITTSRFNYEQRKIGNSPVYIGSDDETLIPIHEITDRPKLVIGLNQNMCRPCVEGVFEEVRKVFPDFDSNPNILCVADIEQRFKDDYYGKKVISFSKKEDFPLYEIVATPYFFILDKDLYVKLLFITDKTSPELTADYLKIIKERYLEN